MEIATNLLRAWVVDVANLPEIDLKNWEYDAKEQKRVGRLYAEIQAGREQVKEIESRIDANLELIGLVTAKAILRGQEKKDKGKGVSNETNKDD